MTSNAEQFKTLSSRRPALQGAVTRQVNALRKLLTSVNPEDVGPCNTLIDKLLNAKQTYDDVYNRIIELGFLLSVDTGAVEATSVMLGRQVLEICEEADGWKDSMRDLVEDTAGPALQQGTVRSASPTKPQLSNIDWKGKFEELETNHQATTGELRDTISALREELDQIKRQVMDTTRSASTPDGSGTRRVTFGNCGLDLTQRKGTSLLGCQRHSPGAMGDISRTTGPPPAHSASATQWYPLSTVEECGAQHDRYCVEAARYGQPATREVPHPYREDGPLNLSARGQRGASYFPAGVQDSLTLQQQILDQSALQQRSLMATINSASAKLEKFTGDPLDYAAFMNSFDELYDEVIDSSRTKLTALIAHCEGKALRAIRWCAHKQADAGYAEARRTLRQKFGSPFAVSQSWLNKLLAHPMLRTPEELDSFACDLRCCKESLGALGYSGELQCTNTLRLIVAKLPLHLRNRWRKIHREYLGGDKGDLMEKLLSLVQDAADDLNDPAFSERAMEKARNTYGSQGTANRAAGAGVGSYRRQMAYSTLGEMELLEEEDTGPSGEPATVLATSGERITCSSCRSTTHFTAKCRRYKDKTPSEKLVFVREAKLCVLCLSNAHTLANCALPWRCQEKGCSERHHTSLHAALAGGTQAGVGIVNSLQVTSSGADLCAAESCNVITGPPCLPVTAVTVRHGDKEINTYALLDNASTITLSTNRLASKLGLPSMGKSRVDLHTIAGTAAEQGDLVSFQIRGANQTKMLRVKQSMTVPHLPISLNHMARAERLKEWKHLANIPVEYVDSRTIDILIGQDNAGLLRPGSRVDGENEDDPYAVHTPLGWTVYGVPGVPGDASVNTCFGISPGHGFTGKVLREEMSTEVSVAPQKFDDDNVWEGCPVAPRPCMLTDCMRETETGSGEDMSEQLERLWKLDEFPTASRHTKDAQYVLDLWEKEWRLDQGHIVLPIPYRSKKENPEFPDNYCAALGSLKSLGKYLKRNPEDLKQYQTAMSKNFSHKFAEKCKKGDKGRKGYTWHLTHHGVDHDRKPGVKRIVKNGAGKYMGISLNSMTFQGPDLMTRLISVLFRFRQYKTGTTGDIEGMFNQVWVPEEERDSQRFLYWENGDPDGEVIVCRMTTHIFGTVWAPSAAMFALKKTVELAARDYTDKILRQIDENFYVDDWHNSEHTEEEAIKSVHGVTEVVSRASFNLTKFLSSSKAVLRAIAPEKRAKEVKTIDLAKDRIPVGFSLGLGWDPEEDRFFFNHRPEPRPETRRGLMSCVSSLYDPLGLITPFTVVAKMLLQQTCRDGAGWDDKLPGEVLTGWSLWLSDLEKLASMRIPRWIGAAPDSRNVLHNFGDASQRAYGAASLVVIKSSHGDVTDCNLLGSKTKLAPLKTQSIPRLELCAATLCVKMDNSLKESLSIKLESSFFWTDSTLVMFYLLGEPANYRPFIANRVSFCQQNTRKQQWGHVPGKSNPADLASRGVRAENLVESDLWLHGPEFLRLPQEQWPETPSLKNHRADESELRKQRAVFSVMGDMLEVNDNTVTDVTGNGWIEGDRAAEQQCYLALCTMDQIQSVKGELKSGTPEDEKESRFFKACSTANSWRQAKRRLAWLRRFAMFYQERKGKGDWIKRKGGLMAVDYQEAEANLLKLTQRWYLDAETRTSKSVKKLGLCYSEGYWRIEGRLQQADIPETERHPILVPAQSEAAKLLVKEAHEKTLHSGVDRTLMQLSRELWVCGARSIASKLIKSCVKCCRLRGRPGEQKMAPLPRSRVAFNTPPFYYTGVDLFGPLQVIIKRSIDKRYGVMYSCLNTRAVHLEVAEDLSASAFICTLERFTQRRGNPKAIKSDNGTNFTKARKIALEVKKILESDETSRALAERHIVWTTNSPAASHQGGAWERMIRTTRELLMAALEGEPVTPDKLSTTMCKVEGVINGRPVTKLYDSPDSIKPLCPNDILTLLPPTPLFPVVFSGERYRRDYRQTQYLLRNFWDEWMKRYVPYLQQRQKWLEEVKDFEVGELVILVQDNYPRFQWPLGVVREVFPGVDGRVRNVLVKTAGGTLRRPIQKLVRLEGDTVRDEPGGIG